MTRLDRLQEIRHANMEITTEMVRPSVPYTGWLCCKADKEYEGGPELTSRETTKS